MAEKLENVLLGDTTTKVVEKINKNISQTLQNADDIEDVKESIKNIEDSVESAGKIDKIKFVTHSGAPTSEYEADKETKVVTLPVYTYEQIDTYVGNLAGGMHYKGTLGVGGTVTELPMAINDSTGQTVVKNGYTYKVITKGTYENQSAEVGDLFIATISAAEGGGWDIQWHLVPSGDDGDVYADDTWSTQDTLVVTNSEEAPGKKVKDSGYTITDENLLDVYSQSDDVKKKKIPTMRSVTESFYRTGVLDLWCMMDFTKITIDGTDTGELQYKCSETSKAAAYKLLKNATLLGVSLRTNNIERQVIADVEVTRDYNAKQITISLKVDPSLVSTFKSHGVVSFGTHARVTELAWD